MCNEMKTYAVRKEAIVKAIREIANELADLSAFEMALGLEARSLRTAETASELIHSEIANTVLMSDRQLRFPAMN